MMEYREFRDKLWRKMERGDITPAEWLDAMGKYKVVDNTRQAAEACLCSGYYLPPNEQGLCKTIIKFGNKPSQKQLRWLLDICRRCRVVINE